jgi:hypothetical protein
MAGHIASLKGEQGIAYFAFVRLCSFCFCAHFGSRSAVCTLLPVVVRHFLSRKVHVFMHIEVFCIIRGEVNPATDNALQESSVMVIEEGSTNSNKMKDEK